MVFTFDGFYCPSYESRGAAKALVKWAASPQFDRTIASEVSPLATHEVSSVTVRAEEATPVVLTGIMRGNRGCRADRLLLETG
jgi:hypothetical protein